jgi:hypothetical protein
MAPDFHYFLDIAPKQYFGHTVRGAFLFCLPVGLSVLWIFQKIMKLPLMSLASETQQQRLVSLAVPFRWGPAMRFLLILFSLLLGTATHLVWDAFTHDRGYFVRNVPDLRNTPLEDFGSDRPLYNVLQHGSSLGGLAILTLWYWRWFKRTPPQPVPAYLKQSGAKKAWIIAVIAAISGSLSLAYAYVVSDHMENFRLFVALVVVVSLSLAFLEVVGYGLWWHARIGRSEHRVIGPSEQRGSNPLSSDHQITRSPDHPIS